MASDRQAGPPDDGATGPEPHQPARWLRELTHIQKRSWPWRRSLRAALSVGAPLGVGVATGNLSHSLWLALGAMISAAGEGEGSYRSRFRQLAISTPMAACGFLFGYLDPLPYPLVIAVITAAAFLSAIISSYGAALSAGAMQCLVFATISIGLPQTAVGPSAIGLFLCGVGVFAATLAVEALLDRNGPERMLLADYVRGLAGLTRLRATMDAASPVNPAFEAARRSFVDQSKNLYAILLETRRNGRTHETVTHAGVIDAAESLFYAVLAAHDRPALGRLATWLDGVADALTHRRPLPDCPPAGDPDDLLAQASLLRARMLTGGEAAPAPPEAQNRRLFRPVFDIRRLAVGRTVSMNAAAVALCMTIALAMRYLLPPNHWYWAPLTVALVMKPDMGSVFVRAVLRTAGTVAGVIIGAAMVILLPKGPEMVIAIAALAACLPWAKSVSYAVMAVVLTPLVLVLLDMMAPGAAAVDLAPERLVNTVIGGAITLVFGYFLWPRSHARELSQQFAGAMNAVADYLVAVCGSGGGPARRAGAACYARLSDMRAIATRCMAEPPPAGREAAAWFPAIMDAERLCDRISAYGAQRGDGAPRPPADEVRQVAEALRMGGDAWRRLVSPQASDPFLADIMRQRAGLARRIQ